MKNVIILVDYQKGNVNKYSNYLLNRMEKFLKKSFENSKVFASCYINNDLFLQVDNHFITEFKDKVSKIEDRVDDLKLENKDVNYFIADMNLTEGKANHYNILAEDGFKISIITDLSNGIGMTLLGDEVELVDSYDLA